MSSLLRPAISLFVLLTAITGLVYPLVVTGAAQALMPEKANGSLVREGDVVVGSSLVGQPFDDERYFWGRPSATPSHPYNAAASSGSNLGPSNPAFADAVRGRIETLRAADPGNTSPVPVDLVTASGSGLDPHVSPAAALYQVPRIARARQLEEAAVRELVTRHVEKPLLGVFGSPCVNVLALNRAVDALAQSSR